MIINVDSLNNTFTQTFICNNYLNLPKERKVFVNVEGSITNSYGKYLLSGNVSAELELECNSCLKNISEQISFPIEETFSKDFTEDEEVWVFSGNNINLEEAITTNILLNLPMRFLCSDDCKGLCKKCGEDLNESSCNCDTGFIDPRFEEFMNIFNKKEV